ncbi:uncharacterized protein LOC117583674 [Drosophila guanche]|uniref:Uncharacterized protein n=1 Tax=Drosophila guanche TaxID=7266 RepID=A0A3B0K7Q8_DROGU|nr:uncharacterized protein LOC117583674 [Drosophila guanche]SPP81031.1 Hypothetical predicted protein [Drosophila guanche]
MPAKTPKLCEIKTNIEESAGDIRDLAIVRDAPPSGVDAGQVEAPHETTTAQLDEIDSKTAAKIAGIQRRRKRRRWKFRQRNKEQQAADVVVKQEPVPNPPDQPRPAPRGKQAEDIDLKRRHDAASMLERLDLLEKLCEARGGDKAKLTEKLAPMRTAWSRVQQATKTGRITESKSTAIERHWDVVFFGSPSSSQRRRRGFKAEFLKRRSIWDSYITQGKGGSCIPRGWVLPTENPTSEWVEYRTE